MSGADKDGAKSSATEGKGPKGPDGAPETRGGAITRGVEDELFLLGVGVDLLFR